MTDNPGKATKTKRKSRYIFYSNLYNFILLIYALAFSFLPIRSFDPVEYSSFQNSVGNVLLVGTAIIGFILVFLSLYVTIIEERRNRLRQYLTIKIGKHPELIILGITEAFSEVFKYLPIKNTIIKGTNEYVAEHINDYTAKCADWIKNTSFNVDKLMKRKRLFLVFTTLFIVKPKIFQYLKYLSTYNNRLKIQSQSLNEEIKKYSNLSRVHQLYIEDNEINYRLIQLEWNAIYCVIIVIISIMLMGGVGTEYVQINTVQDQQTVLLFVNDVFDLQLLNVCNLLIFITLGNFLVFFYQFFKDIIKEPEKAFNKMIFEEAIAMTEEEGNPKDIVDNDFCETGGI